MDSRHETPPYQLSGDLPALHLLLLLRLPPLPDLVLQLLSVHRLLLPVRGVSDVVVDGLPHTLVALEPDLRITEDGRPDPPRLGSLRRSAARTTEGQSILK